MYRSFALAFSAVVILGAGVAFALMGPQGDHREVAWLLAHEPNDLYTNAITVFSETLARESDGELTLRIVRPDNTKYPNGVPYDDILAQLADGSIQMSSTFAVADGTSDNRFWVLGLPFLFSSYEEALASLASPAGKTLLDGLSEKAPYRALAYTLSGGFRIIASDSFLARTTDDLRGKRIATSGGPVAEATLKALGAVPVPMKDGETMGGVDGVETTYTRISETLDTNPAFAKKISELNHSFFLTTIVVDDAFFASLSPKQQQALMKAAEAAAEIERQDSIALAGATKQELIKNGSEVVEPDAAMSTRLQKMTASVAQNLEELFGKETLGAFAH